MAIPKILYRTTDTPAQPSEISTSDAVKGQALTLENGDWNFSQLQKLKANLDSPEFIGTPKAPIAPAGDNSERIATTQWVLSNLDAGTY